MRVVYGLDTHNNLGKLLHKNAKKGRFLMFQTMHLECHQQRSFTLKMHQNRWRLGLCPRPNSSSSSSSFRLLKKLTKRNFYNRGRHTRYVTALPRPPAGLRGPTSKRRGGEGKGGKGRDFGPSQCWRQIDAPVARGRSRSIKMAPTDRSYTT